MSEFDAERYLRLAGERMLLDRLSSREPPWGSPLATVAQALVAAGAIEEGAAEAVLDDYAEATALRDDDERPYRMPRRKAGRKRRMTPPRVATCDRELEVTGGTLRVRYVTLTAGSTRLAVAFRPTPAGGHAMHSIGPGVPQCTLADDRGTQAAAYFVGGGSDEEHSGHLQADRALARDTAWIEVDGTRIELVDAAPHVETSVEPLPPEDPVIRHLWRVVGAGGAFHDHSALERAIEALVAAGKLASDDPAVDDVRAVSAALCYRRHASGRGRRSVPEPWRSMLARRNRPGGPAGTIAIGAATPPFDGVCVVVDCLESDDDRGWRLEVEAEPDVTTMPYRDASARSRAIVWWASDDRGNDYAGHVGDWGGDGERGQGAIEFWPRLDPRATRVDVMPSGETERAVIRIPLRWT